MALLVDPRHDLRNDVDTCTIGARTSGKVVENDGSTESCITRTRQRLKSGMLRRSLYVIVSSFLISGNVP